MADLVQNQNGTHTYQNAGTDVAQAENTGGITSSPLATPQTIAPTQVPKTFGADMLAPQPTVTPQAAPAPVGFSSPNKAIGANALTQPPPAPSTAAKPINPAAPKPSQSGAPTLGTPTKEKPKPTTPGAFGAAAPQQAPSLKAPTFNTTNSQQVTAPPLAPHDTVAPTSTNAAPAPAPANLPPGWERMSPQQQKDANELANYWRSSWQKVSESMASSGLAQDGIAIMAANQAQVDMMGKINEANINEDLAKKADRQFGLDSLSKVLDLADKGLIDHSQVNAMLDALQAGDMGTAGAIMDSFKPVMPQGNYANMEKALATASLYDESHVLYTMSTPYGDGSVDLKPVYMTLQDGTKTLAKSTDPRLTTLLNSGKKIESKFDPATNTVTYTQTDEAIPEGQTPVIAQDGTIEYSNPDAGTAPTYDRTNSDTVPAADYDKWKSAVTGKEGQTPLSESDIPALADFANKGSANAISDLVNVISANAKAFSANIDSLPESVKPKAIDAYAKNIPETQLSLPSLGPIAPGQYFKNGGTLYKMVDSVTDMGTRVTDIPVNIFTYTDVLTGAQNTYKARLQKL